MNKWGKKREVMHSTQFFIAFIGHVNYAFWPEVPFFFSFFLMVLRYEKNT